MRKYKVEVDHISINDIDVFTLGEFVKTDIYGHECKEHVIVILKKRLETIIENYVNFFRKLPDVQSKSNEFRISLRNNTLTNNYDHDLDILYDPLFFISFYIISEETIRVSIEAEW